MNLWVVHSRKTRVAKSKLILALDLREPDLEQNWYLVMVRTVRWALCRGSTSSLQRRAHVARWGHSHTTFDQTLKLVPNSHVTVESKVYFQTEWNRVCRVPFGPCASGFERILQLDINFLNLPALLQSGVLMLCGVQERYSALYSDNTFMVIDERTFPTPPASSFSCRITTCIFVSFSSLAQYYSIARPSSCSGGCDSITWMAIYSICMGVIMPVPKIMIFETQ